MPAPAAQIAAPPGPPRLRLDDKVLAFEFLLLDAQFNEVGQYQLVLSVENPLLEGSVEGVMLSVNHGDIVQSNQAESDIVEQVDLTETINFQKNTYLFILPQGLCKNDKHHDVRLCIDVLKLGNGFHGKGKMVGQALFAIYPRTNQPRINLRAAPFEPLYNYQGILALLRVGGSQLAMHCGRLAYNVCFKEYQPPKAAEKSKSISPRPSILKTLTTHPNTPRFDPNQPSTSKTDSPKPATQATPVRQSSTPRSTKAKAGSPKADSTPAKNTPRSRLSVPGDQGPISEVEQEDRLSPDSASQGEQDDLSEGSDDFPPPSPVHPASSRLPDDAPLHLPSPPKTPSPVKKTRVTEMPPAHSDQAQGTHGDSSILPAPGTETVLVTLHTANNLPPTTAGSVPCPFVTLMTSLGEKKGVRAQSISHATKSPTHNPAWGETLTMTVSEEEAKKEELILTVADSASRDVLLAYRLPLNVLCPFHTYYTSMIQKLFSWILCSWSLLPNMYGGDVSGTPSLQIFGTFHPFFSSTSAGFDSSTSAKLTRPLSPGGPCLNVTIQRRSSILEHPKGFTYSALQVLLGGLEAPLREMSHPLLAVARIVPSYSDYRKSLKPPGGCGVSHINVAFPEPAPSCFQIPQAATEGQPQVSSLGLPISQPVWNSSYLFQGRDGVTLFSEGAALVLEYYTVADDSKLVPWNLSDFFGFSVIPLDMNIYHELMSDSNRKGKTFAGVSIQGSGLKTVSGEPPTVSLQLLLLKSERPEFFLSPMEFQTHNDHQPQQYHPSSRPGGQVANTNEECPDFLLSPMEFHTYNDQQPQQYHPSSRPGGQVANTNEELQRDGPAFPSHNALSDILPNPWSHPTATEPKPADPRGTHGLEDSSPRHISSKNVDLPADPVMEHQEQELSNYRLAMQRMAEDIISLRRQMSGLEAENSRLRSERSMLQDAGQSLLSDADIDVMTKAELADRIVTLKHKLASETSELRGIRDRVQQLQNELVRRNDREKELLLIQRAHQQQQVVLQQYHQRASRAKTLQDTVRKQEKVIEKMERLLDDKLRFEKRSRVEGGDKRDTNERTRVDHLQGEIYATLLAENSRLREELENARQPVITVQQNVPAHETFSATEKFSLLSKLEKSHARVQSLERELEEAARRWGREKQDLLTRLSEQEMGFSRTQTTILHHFPTKDPELSSRRPAKLHPLG